MGWIWQLLLIENEGGSKYLPVRICLVKSLLAWSVRWIPSQMIEEAGSEQEPTVTDLPLTVPVSPHCADQVKLYFPPIPQQA